ncbi:MAG: hypothetical protein RLZZ324_1225 [Candidatus Parcubacteria bacterium]|jgi:signal transduction histidine kinase/MFS family permease
MEKVTFLTFTLFLETLTATFALIFFGVLVREFFRRRQTHLLYSGLSALFLGIGYLSLFLGQVMRGFVGDSLGNVMVYGYQLGTTGAALFSVFSLTGLYLPKRYSVTARISMVLLTGFSIWATLSGGTAVVAYSGYYLPLPATLASWLNIAASLTSGIALLLAGTAKHDNTVRMGGAERAFAWGGAFMIAARALPIFGLMVGFIWSLPISMCLRTIAITATSLAAIAKMNPDRRIAAQPTRFYKQRLLYKAVGMNAILYWVLSFLLVYLTSSYFISASIQDRRAGLRKDVKHFALVRAAADRALLEDTARLAADPVQATVLAAGGAMPRAILSYATEKGTHRVARIVDTRGTVTASSLRDEAVGQWFDSAVMRKALAGDETVGVELSRDAESWVLRAAVPMRIEDGTVSGAVVIDDLSTSFDFSDYTAVTPLNISGYGYIAEDGATVFTTGEGLSLQERERAVTELKAFDSADVMLSGGDELFVERVRPRDGEKDGYFFAIVRESLISAYAFRIMIIAIFVMHMALAAVLALLSFAMSLVLRPIRDLQRAIARMETEDYGARITHRSLDEVGSLADSFNRMSGAIEERESRLKQALREERDFLAHSVRDLRTPINIFRWTLELMRFGDTGKLNRQQQEFLEQLHQTNERLTRTVQGLDDVSRLDQRRYPIQPVDFRMEDVVDEVAGAHSVTMRERNITLGWTRPAVPIGTVRGDKDAFAKILSNIMSNAVKFNVERGHIDIMLSVTEGPGTDGKPVRYAMLTVNDGGRGIPEEEQPSVFGKFFRAKNVMGEEIEGSGLGLHVARRLARLNGGDVRFTSKVGVGSSFHVTFPLATHL